MKFLTRLLIAAVFATVGSVGAQFPLDSSFGVNGKVYFALPGADYSQLFDAKITADGNIITCIVRHSNGSQDPWLVQFKPNGDLDSAFGFNGLQPLSAYGCAFNFISKLELDTFGNIYTYGTSMAYQNAGVTWMQKYSKLGIKDTTFDPLNNYIKVAPNYSGTCMYFELTPTGHYYISVGFDTKIWRFKPDNTPDSSWGGDGIVDSLCPCLKGVYELPNGQVNIVGSGYYNAQPAIWILNKQGIRDLKRTVNGWLVAPEGPSSKLKQGTYCINTLELDKKLQLNVKTLAFQDAFVPRPGFGVNGRNTIKIDTAVWGDVISTIETKEGYLITTWNRRETDDNNYYINYRAGLSPMDATGNLLPKYNSNRRRYILPNEKNNNSVATLCQTADSSFIAGMNIWNKGSYASMLVKLKPITPTAPAAQLQNTPISRLLLYPNPAQSILRAQLGNNEQIQELTIYDRVGRTLHTQTLPYMADSADIDLSAFQSGYYFISITAASLKVFKGSFQIN